MRQPVNVTAGDGWPQPLVEGVTEVERHGWQGDGEGAASGDPQHLVRSCSPLICGDSGQPYPGRPAPPRAHPPGNSFAPLARHPSRAVLQSGIEIAHKGLLAFFERGDARRIPASLAPRIRRILSDLGRRGAAWRHEAAGLPAASADRRPPGPVGAWRVSGNWRIVFRFEDGAAVDVTLIDYH